MSAPTPFKYLKPEHIRRLANFQFAPRMLVEGYYAGRRRSQARGTSIEFRDYRPFVDGDDPSLIDWRVYARTDRRYLKTFEQETNMECHVFLDSSASMAFGREMPKIEYASFLAASLCYLVTHNRDRVALLTFDDRLRAYEPPASTHRHLTRLMHILENNRPGNPTSLATALRTAFPLVKRKGSLIIISDFLDDPAAIFAALSPYLHRGFKIHLFHILAPEELELETRGLATFVDMENNSRLVAHTEHLRPAYRAAMEAFMGSLRELASRRRVSYNPARTDTHFFDLFDTLAR